MEFRAGSPIPGKALLFEAGNSAWAGWVCPSRFLAARFYLLGSLRAWRRPVVSFFYIRDVGKRPAFPSPLQRSLRSPPLFFLICHLRDLMGGSTLRITPADSSVGLVSVVVRHPGLFFTPPPPLHFTIPAFSQSRSARTSSASFESSPQHPPARRGCNLFSLTAHLSAVETPCLCSFLRGV